MKTTVQILNSETGVIARVSRMDTETGRMEMLRDDGEWALCADGAILRTLGEATLHAAIGERYMLGGEPWSPLTSAYVATAPEGA